MSQERIEAFKAMAAEQPEQEMVWYGLANEYVKLEQWGDAAVALRRVVELNADFTAAYQMLGTALLHEGHDEEARRVWRAGVETANRTGAWKARGHMEGLLAGAEETLPGTEFCKE